MAGPARDATHEARAVAQDLLDRSGRALLAGDFDAFRQHFALPNTVATPDGARQIEDVDALRRVFDRIGAFYRGFPDVGLDRVVENALFDGPDTLRYSHVAHILSGGVPVQGPVQSHSVAERRDGVWQVTASHYVVAADSAQRAALLGDSGAAAAADPPDGTPEVLGIFQANLDAVTRAYIVGDFDLLRARVQLPLFKQGSVGPVFFADEAMLRADFDAYMTTLTAHGMTDMVRTVKTAHTLGETRIFGTCRTHVLAGTRLLVPSYVSAVTLEQGADRVWRMTSIMHPLEGGTLDRFVRGGA